MNNEQVGKISYQVTIDTAALIAGTKTAEQAVKGSFNAMEKDISTSMSRSQRHVADFDKSVNNLKNSLKPMAIAAAAAAAVATAGFLSAGRAAFEQVRQVENASFGLRAYEHDASAVNTVLSQLIQYARSDLGVLFQRQDLFAAASTLKGFGESTANLTERVKILSKGVAAGGASFQELSEFVGRAAQAGQLSAIAYDQLARRMIILPAAMRGAKVSADELYEAIDKALDDDILTGRVKTIDGLMIRLQSAWRDLGSSILGVDTATSQFIEGGLGDALSKGVVELTKFIKENKQMIVEVGTGIVVFGSLITTTFLVVKALSVMTAALKILGIAGAVAQVRMLGIIGVLSALIGVFAGSVLGEFIEQTEKSAIGVGDLNDNLDTTTKQGNSAADSIGKLAKSLKKINDDYLYSLAELVKGHRDSIERITDDLKDENTKYNNAVRERLDQFKEEQYKEGEEHNKKTKTLQGQIDFLRKYNNASNRQQLSELQFALAKENSEYAKRNKDRQAKYDADADAQELVQNKRLSDLQQKLDEENSLLNKHAEDVKSIRGVMLLDEIEKLKKSRDEQIKNASESADGVAAQYKSIQPTLAKNMADVGKIAGDAMGDAFYDALTNAVKKTLDKMSQKTTEFWDGAIGQGGSFNKGVDGIQKRVMNWLYPSWGDDWAKTLPKDRKFSTGGFTGAGGKYEMAGVVHKGEYVIPKELVDQTTGMPMASATPSTSNSYSVNINVSGAIVTSAQDQRKFAEVIGKRLNEVMQQKGLSPAIGGI